MALRGLESGYFSSLLGGFKNAALDIPLYIKRIAEINEKVASENEIYLLPNIFDGIYGKPDMFASDGMHLNKKGYKKLAENVNAQLFVAIDELIQTIPAITKKWWIAINKVACQAINTPARVIF